MNDGTIPLAHVAARARLTTFVARPLLAT